MKERSYRVTWTIDLTATSPLDAAKQAREVQRDHASIASVFDVSDESDAWVVDLLAPRRRQVRKLNPRKPLAGSSGGAAAMSVAGFRARPFHFWRHLMFNSHEIVHLSSLDIMICESSSGAPAVISPLNPDDQRVLEENDETLWCN